MERPWFALWVDDFECDEAVKVASNRAVGAYVRLLCHQWREGSLPADRKKLAKIAQETPRDFGKLWPEMAGKFKRTGARLKNPRLERERNAAEERSAKAREAAEARWADAPTMRTDMRTDMRTHSERGAQPMPPQSDPLPQPQELPTSRSVGSSRETAREPEPIGPVVTRFAARFQRPAP